MEKSFKADLDASGLREKLYEQMDKNLVIQVNDILSQFDSELASYQTKAEIDAKTKEGKISVSIPNIPEELQERIKVKLNGLGERENYKITLS